MAMSPLDIITSPWFYTWFVFLFVTWALLTKLFRSVAYFKPKPAACAHQCVVFAPFVFLAGGGTWMWFFDKAFADAFSEDKVYGNYAPAQTLVIVMLAFQMWDFVVTLAVKELRQFQHVAHHGTCILLASIALMNGPNGFLMYYAPYFFGVSEISSCPLAFMDLFKYSKELTLAFPNTFEAIKVSFAVLFLGFRCCYWPFVTYDFWSTTLKSTAPWYLLIFWYICNAGLTFLQYFWGYLIVKGIIKKFKGGNVADAPATQDARECMQQSLQQPNADDAEACA